jgi:hypothetical protein
MLQAELRQIAEREGKAKAPPPIPGPTVGQTVLSMLELAVQKKGRVLWSYAEIVYESERLSTKPHKVVLHSPPRSKYFRSSSAH